MTEETKDANVLNEEPITDAEMNAMSKDDVNKRIIMYRSHINEGGKLSKTAHENAYRCLRQARHRAVAANPHAKKSAKEKAQAITSLDLSQFGA